VRRRLVRPAGVAAGLLLVAGAAAGCGAEASPTEPTSTTAAGTTSTAEATTSTAAPAPVVPTWPLTGVATDDAEGLLQPAIVVKVDNSPQARPHAGINQADIVYELQVEGITRFMEVFHSQTPDRVGPVRSARSSDINLLSNLSRPLLVWSGGNPGVTNEVLMAQDNGLLVDLVHGGAANAEFTRDDSRAGLGYEHTLFANLLGIRTNFTPEDAGPPPAVFSRRGAGESLPATAIDFPGITVDFGMNVRVDYVWDAERGGWDRFQVDERHSPTDAAFVDEAGTQVAPPNVVILNLPYVMSGGSPVAQSVGGGSGMVLTEGKALIVNWMRENADDPWVLIDPSTGNPVPLPAGPTWVALPQQDIDQLVPMSPEVAATLLATRK
jgi:hypothetical protein